MRENNVLEELSFSVMQQDIVLTAAQIYDADLVVESGIKLFKRLFDKADEYDDVLINMGCIPLTEEE